LTSDSKIKANRANARASTGPKTAQGRVRAAGNARRHGLSLPLYANLALSKEVEALAHEIAGTDANAEIRQLACHIAEAQIDLRRVRHARHQFLSDNLNNIHSDSRASVHDKNALIGKLPRSKLSQLSMDALFEYVMTPMPPKPQRSATILSKLVALDRYERRALSRRKFAIREFDAARRKEQKRSS
jgi:hypothetical protein